MKKLIHISAAILFMLIFFSCGKKIDSSVWLSNLDEGKKAASAEQKKILLFFSEDERDGKSKNLKEKIFNTEDFINKYTEDYVLVNLDISNSRYENDQEGIKRDLRAFDLYNADSTPYYLILSAEGYVIDKLVFDAESDLNAARIAFDGAKDSIQNFEDLLAKVKSGKKEEKLDAINKIFDMTSPELAYHLRDLNKKYLALDKKNETGECLKHLIAIAYANAQDFLLDDQVEKAGDEFIKLTKNKILNQDDLQMAFYTAAYILGSSGSQNYEKILSYLQQSYDMNPESDAANNIMNALNQVKMIVEGKVEESESQPQAEGSAE